MPKVTTSTAGAAGGAPTGPALRRNQACKQCRKRKLKCDAQKPHCSTCVKQWNAQIAVPPPVGFSHPAAPLCIYDHMEGLGLQPVNADAVDDPKQRMQLLETQIAELQLKLVSAQRESGIEPTPDYPQTHSRTHSESNSAHLSPPFQSPPQPNGDSSRSSASPANPFQWLSVPPGVVNPAFKPYVEDSTVTPTAQQHRFHQGSSRPSSANSGPSSQLEGLTTTNFTSSATSSRIFPGNVDMDIDGELASGRAYLYDIAGGHGSPSSANCELMYSGWNTDLPDPRLLSHLVDLYFARDTCASRILHRPTFRYAMTLPPTHPDFPHPAILHAICSSASRWTAAVANTRDTKNGERDKFAEFHAAKTRWYIEQTTATGQNIFSVLLAGIILCWWYYGEGRWVEVWTNAGFITRASIPLGLNFPGTYRSQEGSPYLAPPRNPTDLEQRRRAWWMCLMFDRIVSIGGWPHSIDERDVGTELPLRRVDFEAETPGIRSNPQDLASENLFVRHNPLYTDPYILFLKGVMLFGRVTDYNTRMVKLRGPPASATTDPRMAAGFRGLDRLVALDFLDNLPVGMKSCLGLQAGQEPVDGTAVDTDLYMAHIVSHAATITLHNPYINFTDPQCPSATRCLKAARAIIDSYYLVMSTSYDIKRLHPMITICWYLAAVVLVQLCGELIDKGDRQREAVVWGEINLMRMAMIEFGTVSPIGIRQEKLLQGLMGDIVRRTQHTQPLNVGVPLYPFSHRSLWNPTFQPTLQEVEEVNAVVSGVTPAVENTSSLAGRTGERLRAHTAGSPPIIPQQTPYISNAGAVNMGALGMDDMSSVLGVGFNPMATISSQGIWRGVEEHGQPQAVDIFEQLGF